jgi:hypothetical protein
VTPVPQIVHCRLPVAALDSRYGTSCSFKSWSYRLHYLPGACRGLEQLPHRSLSPESSDPQRATVGVNESIPAACLRSVHVYALCSQTWGFRRPDQRFEPVCLVVNKARAAFGAGIGGRVNGPWPDPSCILPAPRSPFHPLFLNQKPLGPCAPLQ